MLFISHRINPHAKAYVTFLLCIFPQFYQKTKRSDKLCKIKSFIISHFLFVLSLLMFYQSNTYFVKHKQRKKYEGFV